MMSEDSLADMGLQKARPVLGDLTNRPGKRKFSVLLGDRDLKSGDGCAKNVGGGSADSQIMNQVPFGGEKFLWERGLVLSKDKEPWGSLSTSTETDTSHENTESLFSDMHRELKKSNVLDGGIPEGFMDAGDVSRDSSFSSVSMATRNKDCPGVDNEGRHASNAPRSNLVQGQVGTICKDNEDVLSVGKLASTKWGYIDWLKFPKQASISHEIGRCATLKGDDCSNMIGDDFINTCSCSFCLKAAYIWSDLQYQDIKGRIAALKKSQKEANTLAQKSCREKETDICSQGDPINSSKLESDLTGHWKSLFCHMEDILVCENNQLQANFLALKDLRENCKMDLEMINGMFSEKH